MQMIKPMGDVEKRLSLRNKIALLIISLKQLTPDIWVNVVYVFQFDMSD